MSARDGPWRKERDIEQPARARERGAREWKSGGRWWRREAKEMEMRVVV
jgi:hypothetical protein